MAGLPVIVGASLVLVTVRLKARQICGGTVVVADSNDYACRGAHITVPGVPESSPVLVLKLAQLGLLAMLYVKRIAGIHVSPGGREAIGTALAYAGDWAARDAGRIVKATDAEGEGLGGTAAVAVVAGYLNGGCVSARERLAVGVKLRLSKAVLMALRCR